MNQYEFKKFPILATVLSAACLLVAVISIAVSLAIDEFYEGTAFLGLLLVVASVLFIAGLTTGRVLLLKIISIVSFVSILVADFVLTIVKFGERDVVLFCIALLMLVAGVLSFVYFLTMKNSRIKTMYLISGLTLTGLTLIYAIIYIVQDLVSSSSFHTGTHVTFYFLLLSYSIATVIPMVIYYSLTKKDEPVEVEAVN